MHGYEIFSLPPAIHRPALRDFPPGCGLGDFDISPKQDLEVVMNGGTVRKIGIVSEYYYPHLGGVTEHVHYFSRELLRRGYEVVLLTGDQGVDPEHPVPPSLRIVRFGKAYPVYSNGSFAKVTLGWGLGRQIRRVLEHERFDLIHIQSPLTPVLPLLFQKYTNTVTVGTFHTYFDSVRCFRVFGRALQGYMERLDGLIAVAPSCVEAMGRYFEADYTIIPNGVDTDWFGRPSGKIEKYNDGISNILFLGRLDPRNGLDILLKAFPRVLDRWPHTRLLIVGDGPLRLFYENLAGPLLNRSIFFEGQINQARPRYFATSHVFCYPAAKASFGITLLEAMAAGTPVVATDNRGFRDIIRHGINGLLVAEDHPAALADTLVKILRDKQLAVKLAEEGRREAGRYSWSHVTDQILGYYEDVYQKKRGMPF